MIETKIIRTNIDKSIDNLKTLLYDATNLNTKRTRAFIIRDERPFVFEGEKKRGEHSMKNHINKLLSLGMALTMIATMAGCGSAETTASVDSGTTASTESASSTAAASGTGEVTKVVFGIKQDLIPNSYVDENGKPAGQNIEVYEKIDELLPQYEFEYDAVDADSILLGIDSGKYAGGLGNYFWNESRAEKYLFPEKNISAGVLGFITTKDHEDLTSYDDVAAQELTVAPKVSSDAVYATIQEYNNEHPDKTVKCDTVGEKLAVGEAMKQVMEGRYDLCVFLKNNYDSVKDEVDPNGDLIFIPFTSIKTWVIFGQGQEELIKAIDGAMQTLEENGTLEEISMKYYGENVYRY